MSELNGKNIKKSLFNLRVLLVKKVVLNPFPRADLKLINQAEDTLSDYAHSLSFVKDYIEQLEQELKEAREQSEHYKTEINKIWKQKQTLDCEIESLKQEKNKLRAFLNIPESLPSFHIDLALESINRKLENPDIFKQDRLN